MTEYMHASDPIASHPARSEVEVFSESNFKQRSATRSLRGLSEHLTSYRDDQKQYVLPGASRIGERPGMYLLWGQRGGVIR